MSGRSSQKHFPTSEYGCSVTQTFALFTCDPRTGLRWLPALHRAPPLEQPHAAMADSQDAEVKVPVAGTGSDTWGKGLRYVERDIVVTKMYYFERTVVAAYVSSLVLHG